MLIELHVLLVKQDSALLRVAHVPSVKTELLLEVEDYVKTVLLVTEILTRYRELAYHVPSVIVLQSVEFALNALLANKHSLVGHVLIVLLDLDQLLVDYVPHALPVSLRIQEVHVLIVLQENIRLVVDYARIVPPGSVVHLVLLPATLVILVKFLYKEDSVLIVVWLGKLGQAYLLSV